MATSTHLMGPLACWLMLFLLGQIMEEMPILMMMKPGQVVPKATTCFLLLRMSSATP
uniref:Alternative protein MMP13 n=1 Tax=Homo sapiens TaxID=9606 RepID=L0R508_HUMAN|nr:alternative protein MMP13 [Homo sapiens]